MTPPLTRPSFLPFPIPLPSDPRRTSTSSVPVEPPRSTFIPKINGSEGGFFGLLFGLLLLLLGVGVGYYLYRRRQKSRGGGGGRFYNLRSGGGGGGTTGRGYINDDAFELPSNRSEIDLNDPTGPEQEAFEGKFARGGGGGGGDQGSGEYESVAVFELNR